MAPSRRLSNGRSPLVRKQSQITAFFSSGANSPNPNSNPTPSPSPCSTSSARKTKKSVLSVPAPSSSSPHDSDHSISLKKKKKPLSSPPERNVYAEEVIGRRVKVFWPLDNVWYEGTIKSIDDESRKHLIQYDDGEEEDIDLKEEKFDFISEEEKPGILRRLRRMSGSNAVSKVMEEGAGEEMTPESSGRSRRQILVVKDDEEEDESAGEDTADDEDWVIFKNDVGDDSDEEMELEEENEEMKPVKSSGKSQSGSSGPRKRKKFEVDKLDCTRKLKLEMNGRKNALVTPMGKSRCHSFGSLNGKQLLDSFESTLTGDAADRFGKREAEKFKFLGKDRKDAVGRRPGDTDYDPRTLYLPQEFLRSLSGGQRQWWEFKSKHMDKVLFFKMGKFYELFEMDAHVGVKELDLQYMKGEQPHCGFPEKKFSLNLEKLANKGYRVLVIEQTETPEQLEIRRREMGSKDKVVKREICAVVSKGTLTEGEKLLINPDASYLMSLTESCQTSEGKIGKCTTLGVCIVDVSTSKFLVGQFEDDVDRHFLCLLLTELRPVEIIKPSKVLSSETEIALKNHLRNPLVNDLVPFEEFWDAKRTIYEISSIYKQSKQPDVDNIVNVIDFVPQVLSQLVSAQENGSYALSALGGCIFYLRQAFLDVSLLRSAKFELLPCKGFNNHLEKPYMILDSSALQNLEILENSLTSGSSGTLFAHLDHCTTSCGKRLLKSWLVRPLYDKNLIVERQDAVAALKDIGLAPALESRKELHRLPDMERLLARLFASCEANGRNGNRVVLYEDAAKKQLQEFISALRGCQTMIQACSTLRSMLSGTTSGLLLHLLTPGKGLPDVSSIMRHFKDAFDWSEAYRSGRIIPREGGDDEYDSACNRVREIESSLSKYLKDQRQELGDASINYVTVGKDLYMLEIPESLSASLSGEYELCSSRKGYSRYWTPKIKKWLSELSFAEEEKEAKLKSIMQRLIGHFREHNTKWRQLVSVTAEIDVLISLAIASDYYEGPTCRPVIKENVHSNESCLSLSAKGLRHPTLRNDALCKGNFVPNDIAIGGPDKPRFILLTGPNMGGKSTLLRQVCLSVILAQIGANVPAESFELSLVDRIFVRMGATDHIMAGQSTFLVELSETAAMLSSATQNSLVALDELGRGTSTSDGQAIAVAVLDYFIHEVKCRGLFSTHYHHLAVDYEKDSKVALCHMACQVGKEVGGVEEVTFLYRLTPGLCPKSYGGNVARLAGIPASVLQKAVAKSSEFENISRERIHSSHNGSGKFIKNDEVAVLRAILQATKSWSYPQGPKPTDLNSVIDIQQKCKLCMARN